MSINDTTGLDAVDPFDIDDPTTGDYQGLWPGDSGSLDLQARRLLLLLLTNRYLSSDTHPREWQPLLDNRGPIESRLNDLFLELVIDHDNEIAYKRRPDTEFSDYPKLFRDDPLNLYETALLFHLRRRLRSGQSEGRDRDQLFEDAEDLIDAVMTYVPETETNQVRARKQAEAAVRGFAASNILLSGNDPDRYRIGPIVETLLPVEKVTEFANFFEHQHGSPSSESGPSTSDPSGEDL